MGWWLSCYHCRAINAFTVCCNLIGAVGGIIVVYGTKLLFALKIDDVVGAILLTCFAGIWGILIVPATNSGANFGTSY